MYTRKEWNRNHKLSSKGHIRENTAKLIGSESLDFCMNYDQKQLTYEVVDGLLLQNYHF